MKAYTTTDLVNAGWTQVTAASITGVSDNYYILVDANSSAYVMSAEADHYRPCYKTIADPKEHPSFVWNLEGSDNTFQLKSFATGAYFKQSSGWNTSVGDGRNGSTASLKFTLSEGKYSIQCVGQGLVGHWNDGGAAVASDGENIAANKAAANAPGFYLYSISKETYNAAIKAARAAEVSTATKESPADVTSYIQNADWSGDWGAWEFTCTSSGNIQWGQQTLESWNANNVIVKQVLSGVPDGLYRLSADLISGNNDNKTAYVFAVGAGEVKSDPVSAVASAGNYNTMSAEVAGNTLTANNIVVTNGVLTVGVNQPSGWIVADNFKLYYMGEDLSIYIEAYHDALDAAGAVNQSDPMNAEVLTALQTALSTYASVDETSKAALQEATSALGNAASDATNSVAAYAKAAAAISSANDIKTNHNFASTEAIATFTSAISSISDKFDAGTLTNDEAINAGTTLGTAISAWRANANGAASIYLSNGFGLHEFDATLYVNTWSNEGENDGSNFKVPFYEYWTGNGESLGERTWEGTLTGVSNGQYKVSAWVRVRAKDGVGATDADGISMQVTDGDAVDVTEGTQAGESQFQLKEYEAIGLVKDGNLTFKMIIASGNNISWLSFKNVKYTKLRDLTPEEIKPLLYAEITTATDSRKSANEGTGVFQIPAAAGTTFAGAISAAQAVYDNGSATADEVYTAIDDLKDAEEAYANTTLNAPEVGKRYCIVVATEGHPKNGLAVGIAPGATSANNPTGYTINTNNTTNQSVAFTQVSGNSYNINFETAEGTTYLTYGTENGSAAGWKDSQIQATTVTLNKGNFTIAATNKANVFNIYNIHTNSTIACQTGGNIYTEAGNADFTLVEATAANMAVNAEAQWGTFCAPFAVAIPSGVTAYTCADATNGVLNLVEVTTTIPANTPVILNAESGLASTTFYGKKVANESEDLIEGGLLRGNVSTSAKNITYTGNEYLLQRNGGKTGFYKVNNENTYKVGYNRCYLVMDSNSDAREAFFFFGDDVTAINAIEAAEAKDGALKDGKYLIGNKVVLVKNGVKYGANGQKLN